jgi:hypothetical protein
MAAELIAVGTGAANSADIVVTDTPVTVSLKDDAGPELAVGCRIDILLKDNVGAYFWIGALSSFTGQRAAVLSGPGTYRLSRTADSAACGAFSA